MKTRPKKVYINFSGVWDRLRMNWFIEGLTCRKNLKNVLRQVRGKNTFLNTLKHDWLDDSSNLRSFTIPTSQMIRAHLIKIFSSTYLS